MNYARIKSQLETQNLINAIKIGLDDDFNMSVVEGIGPDGNTAPDYFGRQTDINTELLRLAIEDQNELGRVISNQLMTYLTKCLDSRNIELDIAA